MNSNLAGEGFCVDEFTFSKSFAYPGFNEQKYPSASLNFDLGRTIPSTRRLPIIELWKGRGRAKRIINHPVLIWGHFLYATIAYGPGATEPMIVVSSREFQDPIALYRKRWEIEVLFSYLKTRGFRMEDTHMVDPERIEKLVFVLAIAFCWAYKIGVVKEAKSPILVKNPWEAVQKPI